MIQLQNYNNEYYDKINQISASQFRNLPQQPRKEKRKNDGINYQKKSEYDDTIEPRTNRT